MCADATLFGWTLDACIRVLLDVAAVRDQEETLMRTKCLATALMTALALAGCSRESPQSSQQPANADAIQDIAPASQPAPPEDAQSPDTDANDEQEAPASR